MVDSNGMRREARRQLDALGIRVPDVRQPVESLSGGQRQSVAVARAAAFGTRLVIMDEPTAALGVRESGMVLDLIRRIRDRGLPVVLISHNMPHVFELADRIHVHRLGRRVAVIRPEDRTMSEVVAIMTGALDPEGHAVAGDPHTEGRRPEAPRRGSAPHGEIPREEARPEAVRRDEAPPPPSR
jgi:fructose transport system ATP-binding protein